MKNRIRKISVLVLMGMLVGMGILVMIPTAAAVGANLPYFDDFEDGNDNGWDVVTGDWTVTESGEYYQSNDGIQDPLKSAYWYDMISVLETPPPTDDYIIQVSMKHDLSYHYYAGLVFRYTSNNPDYPMEQDYYLIIWGMWGGSVNMEFWTYVNWIWDNPASTIIDVVPTEWNTLTADIRGDTFDFYLNGDHVLAATDSQLTTGTVGLYTEFAKVRFDDWSTGIPEPTPQGSNVQINPNPDIEMTFEQVDEPGETTAMAYSGTYLSNFRLTKYGIPAEYYHVTTTAAYSGTVTVGIKNTEIGVSGVDIEHWQGNQWVDITVSRDYSKNKIYGEVSSVYHLGTDPPLVMPAGGLEDNPPYYDGFEDGNDDGWIEQTPTTSEWEVIANEYDQSDMGINGLPPPRYQWDHVAYINYGLIPSSPGSYDNYMIQSKMKWVGFIDWSCNGLVFRYQDEMNYYVVHLVYQPSVSETRLEFWTLINGVFDVAPPGLVLISDPNFDLLEWHTLTANVQDDTFDFYLDGNFMFQVVDTNPSPLTWGTIGLYNDYAHGVFDDWTASFPEPTPSGSNVEVNPYPDVSVEFSNVEVSGETTAIPTSEYPGPDLVDFYIEGVGNFYDISTTAAYTGPLTICLPYDDTGLTLEQELDLNIYHWEGNQWVPTFIVSRDTDNNKICCKVSSLSWFVVGYLTIDPPEVTIDGPASGSLFQVDTPVPFRATFTDTDADDEHSALWEFESGGNIISVDGTVIPGIGGGTVSDDISFINPGVYTVTITVTDIHGLQGTANTVDDLPAFIVIYDPEGGFVTGGGWINSPPGAYKPDPTLEGKATFGFVAKYKKGAQEPTGQTEFKFNVADLNFHSTSYQYLVITGSKAKFKGKGTINGGEEYNFMLWATDGDITDGGGEDLFRIKIWEEDALGNENVIYDNEFETRLGGGQIVIHKT